MNIRVGYSVERPNCPLRTTTTFAVAFMKEKEKIENIEVDYFLKHSGRGKTFMKLDYVDGKGINGLGALKFCLVLGLVGNLSCVII